MKCQQKWHESHLGRNFRSRAQFFMFSSAAIAIAEAHVKMQSPEAGVTIQSMKSMKPEWETHLCCTALLRFGGRLLLGPVFIDTVMSIGAPAKYLSGRGERTGRVLGVKGSKSLVYLGSHTPLLSFRDFLWIFFEDCSISKSQ